MIWRIHSQHSSPFSSCKSFIYRILYNFHSSTNYFKIHQIENNHRRAHIHPTVQVRRGRRLCYIQNQSQAEPRHLAWQVPVLLLTERWHPCRHSSLYFRSWERRAPARLFKARLESGVPRNQSQAGMPVLHLRHAKAVNSNLIQSSQETNHRQDACVTLSGIKYASRVIFSLSEKINMRVITFQGCNSALQKNLTSFSDF